MSRYIDAEKISYFVGARMQILARKEVIDEVPTADVEEVKHGMWIPIQGEYHWAETGVVAPITLGYKCSICGDEEKYKYKYCHCGAKMDKENEK